MKGHENAIVLSDIGFSHGAKQILKAVNARFEQGKITALLGPNGAGKSTLLKILAGLLPVTTGSRHGMGIDRLEHSRRCSWMPPDTQVAFNFSVFKVVSMGLYPWNSGYPSKADLASVHQALGDVCADHLRDRPIHSLSSGEMQRVSLARSLVGSAAFLLLDEPLNKLDLQTVFMVLDILRERAKRGSGVIISMHDLALATQLTDDFLALKLGQVVGSGSLSDALQGGLAESVFGVKAKQVAGVWQLLPLKHGIKSES